tara:strand:+ start:437 stop:1240 length:804 start_codon:yes stop_codon:yes gene_type:complete
MNPYAIDGPAVISFSGGRSSGFMLRNIIDAHGGTLPDDIKVIFANTGLEHHETYEFIHRIEEAWCEVEWLEYTLDGENKHSFKVVDYESASRAGEPFSLLINKMKYLPNPVARTCTANLKIRTIHKYLKKYKWDSWNNILGLRADEQRRVSRMKSDTKGECKIMPMSDALHTKTDVIDFWSNYEFDLNLPLNSNIFGNCVGCYLKGYGKLEAIAREEPDALDWWIETERKTSIKFRIDRPDYATIKRDAHLQQAFDFGDSVSCFCTD